MKAAELMVYHAARLYEAGKPIGEEANTAKLLAADASWAAAEACVQTHGGFGFAEEYLLKESLERLDCIGWLQYQLI